MPAESGSEPSSLVPGGPVPSSLTCTCRGPLLACSPGQMRKSPNAKSPKQEATEEKDQFRILKRTLYLHLGLHLASICNVDVDYIYFLPSLCVQTMHLEQKYGAQL